MSYFVFFISDSTGITVETLGHSLLIQFNHLSFEKKTIPYIDSIPKAKKVFKEISELSKNPRHTIIMFSSIVNPKVREVLSKINGLFADIFDLFIPKLEQAFQTPCSRCVGKFHGISNLNDYENRIAAMNFSLDCDDGSQTKHYDKADIILVGISRSGKTPTSLYLAMHFGMKAANYPLTNEDLETNDLPKILKPYKNKLFGLIIDAKRLHDIREHRLPKSHYASLKQCQREIDYIKKLFDTQHVSYLDSTRLSIEEIAAKIIHQVKNKSIK